MVGQITFLRSRTTLLYSRLLKKLITFVRSSAMHVSFVHISVPASSVFMNMPAPMLACRARTLIELGNGRQQVLVVALLEIKLVQVGFRCAHLCAQWRKLQHRSLNKLFHPRILHLFRSLYPVQGCFGQSGGDAGLAADVWGKLRASKVVVVAKVELV